MEIIGKSNHGFRLRPSFRKIVNKPNKEINYVVNPKQAVRDSFEFSNLINGEIEVEDEIKHIITDEIFHDEVKKELNDVKARNKTGKKVQLLTYKAGGYHQIYQRWRHACKLKQWNNRYYQHQLHKYLI